MQPVYGTSSARTAGSFAAGIEFVETDTGAAYRSLGGGSWVQTRDSSGAALVSQATLLAGEDQTNDVLVVEQGQYGYERVAASASDQVLGASGAAGDFLHGIWIEANTGAITIKDDTTTILTIPASTAIGFHEFNIVSENGAWKIDTAASTSCLCIGRFS